MRKAPFVLLLITLALSTSALAVEREPLRDRRGWQDRFDNRRIVRVIKKVIGVTFGVTSNSDGVTPPRPEPEPKP
jgi:hypothetical protein